MFSVLGTKSTKDLSEQFEAGIGSLPNKTRVLRQIAPESSPERSTKSLSHSFFVVPCLCPRQGGGAVIQNCTPPMKSLRTVLCDLSLKPAAKLEIRTLRFENAAICFAFFGDLIMMGKKLFSSDVPSVPETITLRHLIVGDLILDDVR